MDDHHRTHLFLREGAPTSAVQDPRLLIIAFGAVHVCLAVVGLVLRPESTYDVELYRRWVEGGLRSGTWPVLDEPWVYPVGALLPMSGAAPFASSPLGYALAWFALVTVLNAIALAVLLGSSGHGHVGAWWWLAATAALGPVALGRLDGVVVPITVVALTLAARRPPIAAALLTLGAWVKVAPGAVVLVLAATVPRPLRAVLLPAAVVTALVVGWGLAAGAGANVAGFLGAHGSRGLQIESVAATPYMLSRSWTPSVWAELDTALNTYEVGGADTSAVATVLDVALVLSVVAITWLVWWSGRRASDPTAVLLAGAFAIQLTLVVANKVGSPQFIAWLLPPVAVALSRYGWRSSWRTASVLVLAVAALTQWLFPWAYTDFLWARGPVVLAAAGRNLLLVVLLTFAVAAIPSAAKLSGGLSGGPSGPLLR